MYDLHVCDILHLCLGLQHWKSHNTALRIHARDPNARARAGLRTSGTGPPEREQHQNPTEPPARHAEAPRQQAHPRVLASRFKTPWNPTRGDSAKHTRPRLERPSARHAKRIVRLSRPCLGLLSTRSVRIPLLLLPLYVSLYLE